MMRAINIYKKPGAGRAHCGFSLTEVAIVLGVVGLVVGSIWTIAGAVRKDVQREQFAEQLSATVKNIRGAYLGKPTFNSTLVTTMMPQLTTMKVFPGDNVRNSGGTNVVDSPFGTFANPLSAASPYNSFYVCGWKAVGGVSSSVNCEFTGGTANVPLFAVEVLMPSDDTCIKSVIQNSNPATLPGLVDVSINGYTIVSNGNALPVSVATAKQRCVPKDPSVSNAAVVDFVFRLSPQL